MSISKLNYERIAKCVRTSPFRSRSTGDCADMYALFGKLAGAHDRLCSLIHLNRTLVGPHVKITDWAAEALQPLTGASEGDVEEVVMPVQTPTKPWLKKGGRHS